MHRTEYEGFATVIYPDGKYEDQESYRYEFYYSDARLATEIDNEAYPTLCFIAMLSKLYPGFPEVVQIGVVAEANYEGVELNSLVLRPDELENISSALLDMARRGREAKLKALLESQDV